MYNYFFLSGDNPDLLYQELASDNELEKSVHNGGKLRSVLLRIEIEFFNTQGCVYFRERSMRAFEIKYILFSTI